MLSSDLSVHVGGCGGGGGGRERVAGIKIGITFCLFVLEWHSSFMKRVHTTNIHVQHPLKVII